MRLMLLTALLANLGACDRKQGQPTEPTYEGKPQSEWMRLTKDTDRLTRNHAFEAVKAMYGEGELDADTRKQFDQWQGEMRKAEKERVEGLRRANEDTERQLAQIELRQKKQDLAELQKAEGESWRLSNQINELANSIPQLRKDCDRGMGFNDKGGYVLLPPPKAAIENLLQTEAKIAELKGIRQTLSEKIRQAKVAIDVLEKKIGP